LKFEYLEKLKKREKLTDAVLAALCLALVVVVALAGGCSHAGPAADALATGYCATTDSADQKAMRARMDEETQPHKIRIQCNAQGDQ
jgi:hypothetical protein